MPIYLCIFNCRVNNIPFYETSNDGRKQKYINEIGKTIYRGEISADFYSHGTNFPIGLKAIFVISKKGHEITPIAVVNLD
jgi:hypothetical protein